METAAQEPSLPVLTMSLDTLELRCHAEVQKLEAQESLSQDQRDTLDSIEEEVVACQKYLDYLATLPGGAEVSGGHASCTIQAMLVAPFRPC